MAGKRYNWGIKDIEKALKDVDRLADSSANLEEKHYYSLVRDSLRRELFHLKSNRGMKELSLDDKLYHSTDAILNYGTYYSLISNINELTADFNDFILDASTKVDEFYDDESTDFDKDKRYISHDKTISMVSTFYSSFDKDMSDHYESLLPNKYRIFRFRDKTFLGDTSCCFHLGDRSLFDIHNTKGVEKYLSVVHEIGHSYAFNQNRLGLYDDNTNLFGEVEGMFPEFVALDEGCYSNLADDFIWTYMGNLVPVFSDINYTMIKKAIADAWIKNDYCKSKQLFRVMKDDLEISFSDYKGALDIDLFDTGNYIISLFVSLELLNIYKKDKERAIKIYKEIINMPIGVEYLSFVFNRLEIGKGSLEELDKVKDMITLTLKKKGINL